MPYPSRVQEGERTGDTLGFLKALEAVWKEYHALCDAAKAAGEEEPDMETIWEEEYDAGWILSGHYDKLIAMIEREQAAANHIGDQ